MSNRASTAEGAVDLLQRDGYAIVERLLSTQELDRLRGALEPYDAMKQRGRNDFEGVASRRVYSLAGTGEPFLELAAHPLVCEVADRLMAPNWLLSTLQSIRLLPGETAQPWHTDDGFYLRTRPSPTMGLSSIWAIDDFTEVNGATEVIPGSHRWAMEHPDDRPDDPRMVAEMAAGSVLLFDAALWHRGGDNRSTGDRLCISPQYCQPWLRPQESQLLIAPPELVAGLNLDEATAARVRSMLGYSIHPPFIGQVDGMHPLRLVDPAYRSTSTSAARTADEILRRPAATNEPLPSATDPA